MASLAGIEIGGTKVQVVLGNDQGQIKDRRRFTVKRGEGAAGIQRDIQTALASYAACEKILGVGVGFGGPINHQTGRVSCSHHIEGWSDFPLSEWLVSLLKCEVAVDNDANVAALGEARYGAGAGCSPVFYVTLGSGVGGGLVTTQGIYHGAIPGEAEIGHVRLDRHGGVVENRCSGWAVDKRLREAIQRNPSGHLARFAGNSREGEARFLLASLEAGDADARAVLAEVAEDLAFGLSHVVHLFHPEVIVLGGGLSLMGEPLRTGVAQALTPFLMQAFLPGPSVRLARLGEDVVPVGALELALQNRPRPGPAKA